MQGRSNSVLSDIVVYSMIVGGLLVMTRPGSQGPALLTAATAGYGGIVKAATGQ